LLRKFHEAKVENHDQVTIWGSGSPFREFMHVDDLAHACIFLMDSYSDAQFLNVGTGEEFSIKELALLIKEVVGFQGQIVFDSSKPDGTPRKLMDHTRLSELGFKPNISLHEGLSQVYKAAF